MTFMRGRLCIRSLGAGEYSPEVLGIAIIMRPHFYASELKKFFFVNNNSKKFQNFFPKKFLFQKKSIFSKKIFFKYEFFWIKVNQKNSYLKKI